MGSLSGNLIKKPTIEVESESESLDSMDGSEDSLGSKKSFEDKNLFSDVNQ